MTWAVFIHGNRLDCVTNSPLSSVQYQLDASSLQQLLSTLESASVCPRNPDKHFLTMAATREGQFASSSGDGKAHVEKEFFNGDSYHQTTPTSSCSLLVKQGQCSVCKAYRSQLLAMYSRWSKRAVTPQKYANNRYLNTPQKQK